jgi:hypothetical protein
LVLFSHGAQEVTPEEATTKKGPVVHNVGYRLGTGNEPTEVIRGPEQPKPPVFLLLLFFFLSLKCRAEERMK